MANILSKKVPGWAVTAEATAGSVANMHMIRDGKAQMALTQCDTAYDAIKGLTSSRASPWSRARWRSFIQTWCIS